MPYDSGLDRNPTEAEISKVRRAYYGLVPAYLVLLLAVLLMIVVDWEAGPEAILETLMFVFGAAALALGYQMYVGSLACPRCSRRFLGESISMKPRLIEIADPRCHWCGFSLRSKPKMAYAIDSNRREA